MLRSAIRELSEAIAQPGFLERERRERERDGRSKGVKSLSKEGKKGIYQSGKEEWTEPGCSHAM